MTIEPGGVLKIWTDEDWRMQQDLRNEEGVQEKWSCIGYLFLSADFQALMDDSRFIGFNEENRTLSGYVASDMKERVRSQAHLLLKTLHAEPNVRNKLPNNITVYLDYMQSGNRRGRHLLTATFDLSDSTDFCYSLDRDYRGSGVTENMEERVRMSLHGVSDTGEYLPDEGGLGGIW